jgi:hypothetical protein
MAESALADPCDLHLAQVTPQSLLPLFQIPRQFRLADFQNARVTTGIQAEIDKEFEGP